MGLENLVFQYANSTIFDPQRVNSGETIIIKIVNFGTEDVTNIGLYVVPSTNLGDVDYPADYPPETDYQDLLKWGERTTEGVVVNGGLILDLPQNDGSTLTTYVTRKKGSTNSNKYPLADIPSGSSISISITPEAPSGVMARRLFIDLRVESF